MEPMSPAELLHDPSDDPTWQESMAMVFHDEAAGVGGTAAFGTFANAGTGLTWLGLYDTGPDRTVFQRSSNGLVLDPGDRSPERLGAGSVHWEQRAPGAGTLVAADEDVEVRLEFADLYPPTSWHGGDASLDRLASGHVECSCRVSGTVTVADRTTELAGFGHRDQSWGPRTTDIVRNHRWIAGSCGPALGFTAEALHLADGTVATMGFVARDGEVTRATSVENLVTFDHDGLTPRGYVSRMTLVGGEELTIESDEIHACLYNHRDPLVAIDAFARVRCGSLHGFADLNLIANPQAGTAEPSRLLGGTLRDGLTRLRDGST